MLPLIAIAAGAGLGALSNREKQKEAEKERRYQAEVARWSPWTGMHAQYVQNPSFFGDVAQGAGAGIGLSQNMQSANDARGFNSQYLDILRMNAMKK